MSQSFAQSIAEREAAPRLPFGSGVVVGRVVDNNDGEGLARVKVKFEWLDDFTNSAWARIATPMAGGKRGMYFLPEVDDEVLVVFEHGDVRFPYVIGSLWNGADRPPTDGGDGKNDVRLIRSRSGHVIRLNDTDGHETIEIVDASGNNKLVISTADNDITIAAAHDITLSAPDGTIRLQAKFVDIESSADTTLTAEGKFTAASDDDLVIAGKTVNLN